MRPALQLVLVLRVLLLGQGEGWRRTRRAHTTVARRNA